MLAIPIKTGPSNTEASFLLGYTYHQKEKYDKAIKILNKIIEIKKSNGGKVITRIYLLAGVTYV